MKHHSAGNLEGETRRELTDKMHVLDGLNTELEMTQAGGSVDKRQMLILILRVLY